jgi:predicted  nucleic acid-binding Zn-ribbon protein
MNRQLGLLVSIQNLELQLRDAEDEEKSQQLAELGFPMDVDKIRGDIDGLLSQVETRHKGYYLRLKTRFSNPVVPVWDGHCTGCYANVPTSFASVTNENKVQMCETCGRILFTP